MAKLFWLQPDNTIVEFPLKAEQTLIGRGSRCDVRIKHPGISSEHAIIRVVSGAATVEDMGSTNGTRINGKRITQMQTLRHGDQIGVGRERLMYFAELDAAAHFVQPESVEPFALLAPGGESVNTVPTSRSALRDEIAAVPQLMRSSLGSASVVSPQPADRPADMPTRVTAVVSSDMPLLDVSLVAALPKGSSLNSGNAKMAASVSENSSDAHVAPAGVSAGAAVTGSLDGVAMMQQPRQSLVGSVAVLSGPATGKRYPLTQATVTLGKEGKQVVEFARATPTRWQISQREGTTPAYINGDALEGVRELAAGDVIELTGVRLRFDITLTRE